MNELSTLRNLSYQKSLLSSSIYPSDKNTVQNLIVSRLPIHDKPLGKAAGNQELLLPRTISTQQTWEDASCEDGDAWCGRTASEPNRGNQMGRCC